MPDPKIAALTERIDARARPSAGQPAWWPYPSPLPVRYVSWPCTLPVLPPVPCQLAVHVRDLADLMPVIEAIKEQLRTVYVGRHAPARLIVVTEEVERAWRTREHIDALRGWGISVLPESSVAERLAYTTTVWDDQPYVDRTDRPAPKTWVPEVRGELPGFGGLTATIRGHHRYDLFGQ